MYFKRIPTHPKSPSFQQYFSHSVACESVSSLCTAQRSSEDYHVLILKPNIAFLPCDKVSQNRELEITLEWQFVKKISLAKWI